MADAVLKLAFEVSRVTEEKVALIDDVMRRTSVLALNARLEAAPIPLPLRAPNTPLVIADYALRRPARALTQSCSHLLLPAIN